MARLYMHNGIDGHHMTADVNGKHRYRLSK